MAILETLAHLDALTISAILLSAVLLAHLVSFLADAHSIRANNVPGPLWARFTDAWMGLVALRGHRSETVHELHQKYGNFVRLAPNHVSVNDPDALQIIYAHGNGTLKSNFYDAFVSIRRGVFNTRSRTEHARKRRIITHIFSQKSIQAFEPHVAFHLATIFKQWDRLCEAGLKGLQGSEGEGWRGYGGRVWFDCLPWYNYLAFDIIGDLAFGAPFGMINAARDAVPVAKKHKAAIASYGNTGTDPKSPNCTVEIVEVPAVKILNERGEYSATLGVFPPWWRPLLRRFVPWFSHRNVAVANLAGLSIAAVAKRLGNPTDRSDLLAKLQQAKDDDGMPMGKEELTAEAQTQLIAGSDTTSNSTCALTYHLARDPSIQAKLQKELDDHFGTLPSSHDLDDAQIPTYDQIKNLTYLEAVIHETLRVHSTSGIGLPRVVSEGGLTVLGKTFPEGTILSVPTYSLHRNAQAWGDDVDEFRPERWLDGKVDHSEMLKSFNPFSFGARACVGRHFAIMELQIFIASIFRRYDFVLEKPDKMLETREGFLRKPLECRVGMKRRFA